MLTLNDGRSELWQWDTGRTLAVDADCSQVHFSNKVFGRSIDVDVADGVAIVPDVLLQTDKDLNVWAFVGTAENGYTKISKTFKVNRRNKPADYVFTPPDQTTLAELSGRLDRIEESQDPDAIKNAVEDYLEQNPVKSPVQSVNGQTGKVELTAKDVGAISQDDLQEATNEALAQAKASGEFDGAQGPAGEKGDKGDAGATGATGPQGPKGDTGDTGPQGPKGDTGATGATGPAGADGITPTIGANGNWYLGETDTGKPSRGETGPAGADGRDGADGQPGENGTDGYSPTANVTQTDNGATITITDKNGTTTATVTNGKDGADGNPGADGSPGKDGADGQPGADGAPGADGKSAYQYAQEGGYTGTEAEFAAKLAQEKFANPNALTFTGAVTGIYDGSEPVSVEIPSGGGGGYPETIDITTLATGTISTGTNGGFDTGLTYADFKDYDWFEICIHGPTVTGGTWGFAERERPENWRRFNIADGRGKILLKKITKTVYSGQYANGNVSPTRPSDYNAYSNSAYTPSQTLFRFGWSDNTKLYIVNSDETKADIQFTVSGYKFN